MAIAATESITLYKPVSVLLIDLCKALPNVESGETQGSH